jgi:hypothetical protein
MKLADDTHKIGEVVIELANAIVRPFAIAPKPPLPAIDVNLQFSANVPFLLQYTTVQVETAPSDRAPIAGTEHFACPTIL